MDLDLYSIGQKVFSFYIAYVLMTTIIGGTLAASGAPYDMISVPIFTPANQFYQMIINVMANNPIPIVNGSWAITDPSQISNALPLAVGIFIVVQLLAGVFSGFANLAMTLIIMFRAYMPDLLFLAVPMAITFGFLQIAVYYYMVIKLKEILSPYIAYTK